MSLYNRQRYLHLYDMQNTDSAAGINCCLFCLYLAQIIQRIIRIWSNTLSSKYISTAYHDSMLSACLQVKNVVIITGAMLHLGQGARPT